MTMNAGFASINFGKKNYFMGGVNLSVAILCLFSMVRG